MGNHKISYSLPAPRASLISHQTPNPILEESWFWFSPWVWWKEHPESRLLQEFFWSHTPCLGRQPIRWCAWDWSWAECACLWSRDWSSKEFRFPLRPKIQGPDWAGFWLFYFSKILKPPYHKQAVNSGSIFSNRIGWFFLKLIRVFLTYSVPNSCLPLQETRPLQFSSLFAGDQSLRWHAPGYFLHSIALEELFRWETGAESGCPNQSLILSHPPWKPLIPRSQDTLSSLV